MKRIFVCVLSVIIVLNLSSCSNTPVSLQNEDRTIAVKYGSANEIASDEYVSQDFTKVTYNSSSDVVLAVENGKSDCGILDDFELNSYLSAGRKIKKSETCVYSIDYCAYFSSENELLKESFDEAITELKNNGALERIKAAHLNGKAFSGSEKDNDKGTLVMLCDPSFEKRVYTDDNGNITGLDVDIAEEICNFLGYDLEIVTADFDELFLMLRNGEGDFIISACEVNEERAEYYLLSDVYFTLKYHLIERA